MSGSELTKEGIYFEENLSRADDTVDRGIAVGSVMLVVGVLPTTVIAILKAMQEPVWWLAVVLIWGIAFAMWKILQKRKETSVNVQVKSDGVFVDQTPKPWLGTGGEYVSFDDISGVQYSLAETSPRIHLTEEDKQKSAEQLNMENDPARFMVARQSSNNALNAGTYRGGIRIERTNGPPVYIGSETPNKLSAVIVEQSPLVDHAEKLFT